MYSQSYQDMIHLKEFIDKVSGYWILTKIRHLGRPMDDNSDNCQIQLSNLDRRGIGPQYTLIDVQGN